MIDSQAQLTDLVRRVAAAPWVAVDTEADSLYTYPERLCLLQISLPGTEELVDPLARLDLIPLVAALEKSQVILHGGDFDLRLLQRNFGKVPRGVFDTMLAARFLGLREFSLAYLAAHYLGVVLEKGPQKANWSRRPLTQRMLDYARNDTRYLKPLADVLTEQLRDLGRLSWHAESCDRLVSGCAEARPRDPDVCWRIKGGDRLSRKSLGVLREVWSWREQEAMVTHRPPYFILSHEALVSVASAAGEGRGLEFPPHLSQRRREAVIEAVQRALALPVTRLPHPARHVQARMNEQAQRRHQELRQRRDAAAERLKLDPAFIASRTLLVSLAANGQSQNPALMQWQRELLGLV